MSSRDEAVKVGAAQYERLGPAGTDAGRRDLVAMTLDKLHDAGLIVWADELEPAGLEYADGDFVAGRYLLPDGDHASEVLYRKREDPAITRTSAESAAREPGSPDRKREAS